MLGVLVALFAGLVPFVVGTGRSASSPGNSPGTSWLQDAANGSFVRVNGRTGKIDARTGTSEIADGALASSQVNGRVVIVTADGRTTSFDVSSLNWDSATNQQAAGSNLVSREEPPTTYLVVRGTGQVRYLDPTTQAVLETVQLRSVVGQSSVDPDGSLWVVRKRDGTLTKIIDGVVKQRIDVAAANHDVDVSIVGKTVFVVDKTAHVARRITDGRVGKPVRLGSTSSGLRVPATLEDATLWLAEPSTGDLLGIPVKGKQKVRKVHVARPGTKLRGPVANKGHVYLLTADGTKTQVLEVNARTGQITQRTDYPAKDLDQVTITVRGGIVYVNDPTISQAIAIPKPGGALPVDKSKTLGVVQGPEPRAAAEGDPTPLPLPAVVDGGIDGPNGPGAGQNPNGGGPGGGGPSNPVDTTPQTAPITTPVSIPAPTPTAVYDPSSRLVVVTWPEVRADGVSINGYVAAADGGTQPVDQTTTQARFQLGAGDHSGTVAATATGQGTTGPAGTWSVTVPPDAAAPPTLEILNADVSSPRRVTLTWVTTGATTIEYAYSNYESEKVLPAPADGTVGSETLSGRAGPATVAVTATGPGGSVTKSIQFVIVDGIDIRSVAITGGGSSSRNRTVVVDTTINESDYCVIRVYYGGFLTALSTGRNQGSELLPAALCGSPIPVTLPYQGTEYIAEVVSVNDVAPPSQVLSAQISTNEASATLAPPYTHFRRPDATSQSVDGWANDDGSGGGVVFIACQSTTDPSFYLHYSAAHGGAHGWVTGVSPDGPVRPCDATDEAQSTLRDSTTNEV